MSDKVALFDFCETLTDFQTADAFVDYVRQSSRKRRMLVIDSLQRFLWRTRVMVYIERFFQGHSINKRLKLYQLKGFSQQNLDEYAHKYYIERIKPHFIRPLLEKLMSLRDDNYYVGLVSGGYGIYLRYFVEEYNLGFCISSNIEIKDGICTGKLFGVDCMGSNKIVLLNEFFPIKPIETIAFSDSRSDIPLLLWVKQGVVISKNNHQNWIDQYEFNEIIWKQKQV